MRKISAYLLLLMAAALLLCPLLCAGQETYTRTYRVDSLGTAKWYLAQIDTWTAPVSVFSSDSSRTVQENRFFAASKAELISLVEGLRTQAAAQKTAAEKDMVRADSMYAKLSNIHTRLTDHSPDTFPFSRNSPAPPLPATNGKQQTAKGKGQKGKGQ